MAVNRRCGMEDATWKVDWSRKAQRVTKNVAGEGAKLPAKSQAQAARPPLAGHAAGSARPMLAHMSLAGSAALVAADVGMAIGAGTNIAIEAVDIILMKSNLEDVISAIDLSRKTFFRIRLNYFWALDYNLFGIPIAALELFPIYKVPIATLDCWGCHGCLLCQRCLLLSAVEMLFEEVWGRGCLAAWVAHPPLAGTRTGLRDSCGSTWVSQPGACLREVDARRGLRDLAALRTLSRDTLGGAPRLMCDQSTFHVRIPHSTFVGLVMCTMGVAALTPHTGTYP
ncbi:hypothetical protein Fmac_013562 [Flemingia macrophylla]|uniref:Uncharacterized protein n=1 Tax=Flemingia macrophylla TaxID=520843 RepID=A0ABD1MTG8_9FABA